jgi:hypothetical protein
LGVCASLKRHGILFDAVEKCDQVGGNWYNGVYETVHIISSKKTTEYKDWPMPDTYPDFPSAEQMFTYMNNYCDFFKIRKHIQFRTEATDITALDQGKKWRVKLKDLANNIEKEFVYKGVIIANGHHWNKRLPQYRGQDTFTGELIHSKDYKKPSQLIDKRVLIIGGGNSACDISVESARFAQEAHVSQRRGYWFLPRTIFGIPLVEMVRPWMPLWMQRLLLRLAVQIIFGSYERYGLQRPDHRIFDVHPTINSELLHYIKLGEVHPHPDIECFLGGKKLKFVDGTEQEFDMIVCCTGYYTSIPLLDKYVKTVDNVPQLLSGIFVPNMYNVYYLGMGQPRYGAGPLLTVGAEFIAKAIVTQEKLRHPLSSLMKLIGSSVPRKSAYSADILVDPHSAYKEGVMATYALNFFPWIEKMAVWLKMLH